MCVLEGRGQGGVVVLQRGVLSFKPQLLRFGVGVRSALKDGDHVGDEHLKGSVELRGSQALRCVAFFARKVELGLQRLVLLVNGLEAGFKIVERGGARGWLCRLHWRHFFFKVYNIFVSACESRGRTTLILNS